MKFKVNKKHMTYAGMIGNTLYTTIFLFTLLITINALIGTLTNRQPSVFGYSVSKILSGSMEADGFNVDDYVVTKQVRSADDIRVADLANGTRGDIITFYTNPDKTPVREGDDRKDARIVFHEVIGVTEEGYFITKGSSNLTEDPHPIPFESVSGVYVETAGFAGFLITAILADNRFLYWVIAVLALIAVKQIFMFLRASNDVSIQRQVMKGEIGLLDKVCFERNIFGDFTDKSKKKLIENAPDGLSLVYEYMLYGRITARSDEEISNMVQGKRCSIDDVLCFTYAQEPKSTINPTEYAEQLPERKKKFEKYRNPAEFNRQCKAEKNSALSLAIGTALFSILYFVVAIALGYLAVAKWYEVLIVIILPLLADFYVFVVITENRSTARKLKQYLEISEQLPKCYHFIIRPDIYSQDEISKSFEEVCKRLKSSPKKQAPKAESAE